MTDDPVIARATITATIRVEGGWLALALFALAERCGLEVHVQSIGFDEPIQTLADRIAVERMTAPGGYGP